MVKKLNMKMKTNKNSEDWVKKGTDTALNMQNIQRKKQEKIKRLTIDITEDLHKRIKKKCVDKNSNMADELRRILEKEF